MEMGTTDLIARARAGDTTRSATWSRATRWPGSNAECVAPGFRGVRAGPGPGRADRGPGGAGHRRGGAGALFADAAQRLLPWQRRPARAFGMWAAGASVALSAGPLIGGLLIAAAGWRAIFFINLPIGLFAIGLTIRYARETPRSPERGVRRKFCGLRDVTPFSATAPPGPG